MKQTEIIAHLRDLRESQAEFAKINGDEIYKHDVEALDAAIDALERIRWRKVGEEKPKHRRRTMAERAIETVCTNCAHRNVCKWTEGFLKLVQMVNETQFKYGVDVDEPIKVKCREWQMKIETPRNIS